MLKTSEVSAESGAALFLVLGVAAFSLLAPAGVLAWGWQEHGWTRVYTDWNAYPLWYLPLAPLIYLFLHDAWFYWTHRAMHAPWP